MNALLPLSPVDFGTDADDVRFEDKELDRRSTPTLLLSYITRLAGSLSFFDGLANALLLVELDIDLILVFRVSSGRASAAAVASADPTSGGLDD
jgi:hypothetical protein